MEQTKKYNAFISYKHSEPDIYIATQIQKKLERFKLPKSLRKKYPKERWKINRIFRDQDELTLADNLSEEIDEALKDSEYLIIICTPRLKASEWCKRESEVFKDLYGLEHTLLVLAEGEPEDSFPENQWYRDKEITDENGNIKIIREDVEPLAADVRATDKKTLDKMINNAVLRLAAQMYGIDYDDLKRRHREQRIHLIAGISGIAAGVFFIFGLVCFFLMMQINSLKGNLEDKNIQLEESNSRLEDMNRDINNKNEELEALNTELQEQYTLEQEKYAKSMKSVSQELLENGLRLDSLYAVRNAMPSSKNDTSVPYVASAEYALSNALFAYDNEVLVPTEILPMIPYDDDEFWGDFEEYRYLDQWFTDDRLVGMGFIKDDILLLVSFNGNFYIHNDDIAGFVNVNNLYFAEKPTPHVNCATCKDHKLYLNFSGTDYMVCYEYLQRDDVIKVETQTDVNLYNLHGALMREGEEKASSDGKYKIKAGSNRKVYIYGENEDDPVKIFYDISGYVFGMNKLEGTDYYILITGSRCSYLLDKNLDMVARIGFYYGYSKEDKRILTYRQDDFNWSDFTIYSYPIKSYDELISEADELLKDYTPSEETLLKYEMLK